AFAHHAAEIAGQYGDFLRREKPQPRLPVERPGGVTEPFGLQGEALQPIAGHAVRRPEIAHVMSDPGLLAELLRNRDLEGSGLAERGRSDAPDVTAHERENQARIDAAR